MPQANINDRTSMEGLYPLEQFRRDAGANSMAKTTVHHGVAILSPPDPDGAFEARRLGRQVGENDPEADARFLAPFLRSDAASFAQKPQSYGGTGERGDPLDKAEQKNDDYDAFITRVLDVARTAEFKGSIGDGEERLKGFRGG